MLKKQFHKIHINDMMISGFSIEYKYRQEEKDKRNMHCSHKFMCISLTLSDNAKIYKKLHDALHGKKRCAIATIVNVNGSVYRKEGEKMYIDEDEKTVGMIS